MLLHRGDAVPPHEVVHKEACFLSFCFWPSPPALRPASLLLYLTGPFSLPPCVLFPSIMHFHLFCSLSQCSLPPPFLPSVSPQLRGAKVLASNSLQHDSFEFTVECAFSCNPPLSMLLNSVAILRVSAAHMYVLCTLVSSGKGWVRCGSRRLEALEVRCVIVKGPPRPSLKKN
ncbi:hypothetical protein BGZ63DRAFT_369976 [Mariannaea sp. PMI_226]|nr:hypothetical protein BGZ63DRAFT_369976 [Mariannaea sp. PMI_226]